MRRHLRDTALLLCLVPFTAAAACASAPAASASDPEVARYAAGLLARNYPADGPGAAVLVARGDTVLFRGARGEADVDADVPLRPDSVFRIASVTKQIAAAGLLRLVESGKVKLDDPVAKYIRDFPGGERITVLHLLNHTSGVKDYTAIPGYVDAHILDDAGTAQMIDAFEREQPDFEPGTRWAYSNSGYVLVGAVIEAASGLPWHAYLDRVFFRPLGMKNTGYGHDPKFAARQVRGYSYRGGEVVPAQAMSMTQPHAAGALVSNVDDLLRWNRALHEGRVLRSAAYTRMVTPVGKAADAGYGFGIYREKVRTHDALRHGGAIFGFASALSYLPGPDVTVVVLENDDASNSPENARDVARRLAAMAVGDPYPAPQAAAVEASALKAAEGAYSFPGGAARILRVVDGKLTARQGRRGHPEVLIPIAEDDFLFENGFDRLKLERRPGGAVTGARFFPKGDGKGEVGVRTDEALRASTGMRLPRAALERVTGSYASGRFSLKVYLKGEELLAELAGQEPITLRAESPTHFDVEETSATLTFAADGASAADVTLRQNGREIVLKRVP